MAAPRQEALIAPFEPQRMGELVIFPRIQSPIPEIDPDPKAKVEKSTEWIPRPILHSAAAAPEPEPTSHWLDDYVNMHEIFASADRPETPIFESPTARGKRQMDLLVREAGMTEIGATPEPPVDWTN